MSPSSLTAQPNCAPGLSPWKVWRTRTGSTKRPPCPAAWPVRVASAPSVAAASTARTSRGRLTGMVVSPVGVADRAGRSLGATLGAGAERGFQDPAQFRQAVGARMPERRWRHPERAAERIGQVAVAREAELAGERRELDARLDEGVE